MHTKEIGAKAGSRAIWLGTYFKLFACLNRTVLTQNGANLVHPSGCQWLMKNSQILDFFLLQPGFWKEPRNSLSKICRVFYQ